MLGYKGRLTVRAEMHLLVRKFFSKLVMKIGTDVE